MRLLCLQTGKMIENFRVAGRVEPCFEICHDETLEALTLVSVQLGDRDVVGERRDRLLSFVHGGLVLRWKGNEVILRRDRSHA
jgi:hypothetical protein